MDKNEELSSDLNRTLECARYFLGWVFLRWVLRTSLKTSNMDTVQRERGKAFLPEKEKERLANFPCLVSDTERRVHNQTEETDSGGMASTAVRYARARPGRQQCAELGMTASEAGGRQDERYCSETVNVCPVDG